MVCDNCKEGKAVIQLTEVEGTGVRQLHLCEKCAAERGVETTVSAAKPQINEFLHTLHQQLPAAQGDAARCTFCSSTMKDFRATGRLGCPNCYDSFETSLRDLLRRVHGNSRHVGRRYKAPSASDQPHVSIAAELRDRLQRAIETEQFEVAADIRDKLRGIE
ncbi:MAG: UvrB/UvrC motif-containing protein [Gemmatimonadaceae bacterium]|nr:UvrB/UvrC motif-containing protein [Gemmatimonadaceae bacterium]